MERKEKAMSDRFGIVFTICLFALWTVAIILMANASDPRWQPPTTTTWVGLVPSGGEFNGQWSGSVGVIEGHELGLRSDGVVVWRKRQEMTTAFHPIPTPAICASMVVAPIKAYDTVGSISGEFHMNEETKER
jgi:hypothetical protein